MQADRRKRMLFICTHNSARSQMAEGLIRTLYPERYEPYSAGTEPSALNPYAVEVMAESGIDISSHRSKHVNEFLGMDIDYVITVCDQAKQVCPFFPAGKESMHKGFEDPAAFDGSEDEKIAIFRRVRDEIRDWIVETFGGEGKGERLK
ncbi:MAG: arsenate reductase ArsC [Deltaproteobacteria bacterium]|nr:arsenate reductase ArsC [Deltaproteobacteria bacterium]